LDRIGIAGGCYHVVEQKWHGHRLAGCGSNPRSSQRALKVRKQSAP
jgi:hypothetical protein